MGRKGNMNSPLTLTNCQIETKDNKEKIFIENGKITHRKNTTKNDMKIRLKLTIMSQL